MKKKRVSRIILSLLFVFYIVCSFRVAPAIAADPELTIRNIYDNFQRVEKIVEIHDSRMIGYKTIKMNVKPKDGSVILDLPVKAVSSTRIEAELNKEWDVDYIVVRLSDGAIGQNDLDLEFNNINEDGIPEVTSIQTPVVQQGQEILVSGATNLNDLTDPLGYQLFIGTKTAKATEVTAKQVKLTPADADESFQTGVQDIIVTRSVDTGSFSLNNTFVYKSAVNVVAAINLTDITMFPTMGEPDSKVCFTRDNLENWDIYFIKDLNDPSLFNQTNLAKNYTLNAKPYDEDVITVTVPQVDSGSYNIVFTNKNSIKEGIKARATLEGQQYTVIYVSQQPIILDNIEPDSAPCQTATNVTINGYYFAPHNIPGFSPDGSPNCVINNGKAVIDYGSGTLTIGTQTYNVNVTRTVTFDIGRSLELTYTNLNDRFDQVNDLNIFEVKTVPFNVDEVQTHDVKVVMDTKITGGFQSDLRKEVVLTQAFTYLPSTEKPVLNSITPAIISVKESGGNYYINVNPGMDRNELLVALKGQKFLVTRYVDEGVEKTRYPIVKMGGININFNDGALAGDYRPEKMEVLSGDKIVDGSENNQLGDTMLIWLKTGTSGVQVLSKDSREVMIQNPIRQSNAFSGIYTFPDTVTFTEIGDNEFPVIDNVNPSLVSVDGGEDVIITGSNLRVGAKVYIAGEELPVSSYKVSGDNKTISLKTPKERAGATLLQVENPEGGIASHSFTYTTTYTDPKITSINPNEGSARTIITTKGENFLRSDPTVIIESSFTPDEDIVLDEHLVYRLIGSRILMDGYDINEYYKIGGRIAFTPYVNGVNGRSIEDDMFIYDCNMVDMGDGFNSVILLDQTNKKFYRIARDVKNQLWIEDGQGVQYNVIYDNGFKVLKEGTSLQLNMSTKGRVTIEDTTPITLTAYTPFQISKIDGNDAITGNRVNFVDSKTLTFEVPVLANTPWTGDADLYDVTVINPDTKRATLQRVFRYFTNPTIIPAVTNVEPDQGPDQGGTRIIIYGSVDNDIHTGFANTGASKTRVFFGDQEALPEDILVSVDGSRLTVTVPKYNESIKDKGTDRVTVPIVLVNPDGGAFSISTDRPLVVSTKKILGYTYVVPTSNPAIHEIVPAQGSANGGYEVEIFGSDFRYEEPFIDQNGNGKWDLGESYTDIDGDEDYSVADLTAKRTSVYNPEKECLSSVLLPKVYVGNKEAEIIHISLQSMMIIVPPGNETADVYIVNNDCGISNKVKFTFLSSDPKISSVTPACGRKQGGDKAEILGEGFEKGTVNFLDSNGIQTGDLVKVRFANRTNKDLSREDTNSGVVKAPPTIVKLDGNLEVSFDGENSSLDLSITQSGETYSKTFTWNGEQTVFINTKELRLLPQDVFPYEELICCELEELYGSHRLLVEAGYAPAVDYLDSGHLIVTTPGYYTIGQVGLTVLNPDGGMAEEEFEYKNPATHPIITNITCNGEDPVEEDGKRVLKINYKDESAIISVFGQDFTNLAQVMIGSAFPDGVKEITYYVPNKLSFSLPAVKETELGKLQRVVVTNEDGASAASDESIIPMYIQFIKGETEPYVTKVNPLLGPSTGGTVITIEGKDFRALMTDYGNNKLTVSFDEKLVSYDNITVVDRTSIRVISPENSPGITKVKVKNPDGAISVPGEFTYISTPKIISVVDPDDPTENQRVRDVSVEGGQIIKIKGSGFMSGAKVIFVPVTEAVNDDSTAAANMIYRVGTKMVSGLSSTVIANYNLKSGTETNSTFIDEETLSVEVPAGKLDTKGIIVVNPDQGASELYDDLTYTLTGLNAPAGVTAEIIHDQYNNTDLAVKVYWQSVENASQYDVYISIDGKALEYVGSTPQDAFLYKDLNERTSYRFVIKAVGQYVCSPPSLMSNEVTTGSRVGAPDTDGAPGEKTQQTASGSTATITIGTDDYDKEISVDLTRGVLAGCRNVVISMPAEVVRSSRAGNIEVIGSDFALRFNPRVFNIGMIENISNTETDGVRFQIVPVLKAPTGSSRALGSIYQMEANAYVGNNTAQIDYLLGNIYLAVDEDYMKTSLRRIRKTALYRYDIGKQAWDTTYNWSTLGSTSLVPVNRLGYYTVMGIRR
ncbi:MAG: IPT/TIG domain-containing protein [Bacillota bacterium]|nr:IPT/TIG domain-containing protein [Bacillota bacterium]